VANKKLTTGAAFTAISGTFANLTDGSTLTAGRNNFQVSYAGGGGNAVTLTAVP
jgi:hypothetical protein